MVTNTDITSHSQVVNCSDPTKDIIVIGMIEDGNSTNYNKNFAPILVPRTYPRDAGSAFATGWYISGSQRGYFKFEFVQGNKNQITNIYAYYNSTTTYGGSSDKPIYLRIFEKS